MLHSHVFEISHGYILIWRWGVFVSTFHSGEGDYGSVFLSDGLYTVSLGLFLQPSVLLPPVSVGLRLP